MHRQELAGIPGRGRGVSYPALPISGAKRTAANGIGKRDRGVKPVSSEPGWIPRVFIAAQAFERLKLYIQLCPSEVGGLGTVESHQGNLFVTSISLIRQRASDVDTELDPEAIADHLLRILQEAGDLSAVRLWWHSHAEGQIFWSKTDEETIENLRIDPLLSIVGNKRCEFRCRLDLFSPDRITLDSLPLLPLPNDLPADPDSLRREVLAELRKKLSLFRREVSLVPELILGASEALEIQVPFEEPEPRQHS